MEFQSVKQGVSDCGITAAVVALRGMRQRSLSSLNESGFIIHVQSTIYQVYLSAFILLKMAHLLRTVIQFTIVPTFSINFLTVFYGWLWKSNFLSGNHSYENFYLLTLHHRWNLFCSQVTFWWKAFVKKGLRQGCWKGFLKINRFNDCYTMSLLHFT